MIAVRYIANNQFKVFCATVICLMVAACGGPKKQEVGTYVSDVYSPPAHYYDHRAQQQFFGAPGERIAYTDHGTGPVIVLLHGVPTSSWMYRNIISALQNDMRVISIDLLGYGSADKPDDETGKAYAPSAQATRVRALLAAKNIDRYALLMHDMGGLVAWEILRANPDKVSHTIVLNTIVNQTGFNHPTMRAGDLTRQLMSAYASDLTNSVILRKTFSDLGLTGEHKLTEAECAGYVIPMLEGADTALYAFFTQLNELTFDALDQNRILMKSFSGESLIMWGAKDETLTTGQIPIAQDMLGTSAENIHIYDDNGHFLAEEIPAELVKNIRALMLN